MQAGAVHLPQFKIAILGSKGCGKKQYIKSLVSKQVENIQHYINPQKTKTITIQVQSKIGPILIVLQYINAQIKQTHDSQQNQRNIQYLTDFQGAVIMFQVTDRQSYKKRLYTTDCLLTSDNKQFKFAWSETKMVKAKQITFHRKKNLQYYDVSSTHNYNVLKPITWIIKKITNNPQFALIDGESLLTYQQISIEQSQLLEINSKLVQEQMNNVKILQDQEN